MATATPRWTRLEHAERRDQVHYLLLATLTTLVRSVLPEVERR